MKIHPYVMFNGQCEAAFRFYSECLEGKIEFMQKYGDSPDACADDKEMGSPKYKDYVMHVSMTMAGPAGTMIMGSDCPPARATTMGDNINISLSYLDEATQTKHFDAMARGGEVRMPLADTFWGARFGMIKDKFGVCWMFNCEKAPKK